MSCCSGVYWIGHVYDMGGYGNVSRNYLRAMETAGIPVFIHPVGEEHAEIGPETKQWLERLSNPNIGERAVYVFHSLPWEGFAKAPLPHAAKKIFITLFETDRLPQDWPSICNMVDEVWVPSSFNFNTFLQSGVIASKLKVLPYAIDVSQFYPGRPHEPFPFPAGIGSFKFTYVFNFDYRKGYDLLIRSFCEEFGADEDVALVLKLYIYKQEYSYEHVMAEICSHIPPDRFQKQIVVFVEPFTQEQLISLYASSDVYVSMDRACGWGMTVMEAMALGIPTVAIRWGGSTQFMNDRNSFLIETEGRLVPVDAKLQQARPNVYYGHMWADVSIRNVRKTLREAYANKAKREAVARQGAYDIHTQYSPYAIGLQMKRLLKEG